MNAVEFCDDVFKYTTLVMPTIIGAPKGNLPIAMNKDDVCTCYLEIFLIRGQGNSKKVKKQWGKGNSIGQW